jgi:hypothetical protein
MTDALTLFQLLRLGLGSPLSGILTGLLCAKDGNKNMHPYSGVYTREETVNTCHWDWRW